MKCECGSQKIQALNTDNFDYLVNLVDNKWTLVEPQLKHFFFSTKRNWQAHCFDCKKHFQIPYDHITEFHQPDLNCNEIVLDLDHTLFYVLNDYHDYVPDHYHSTFKHHDKSINFFVRKRPYLDKFIKFCLSQYDKINIFTSASPLYAQELVKILNIPSNKLGYVKTIEDTVNARSIKFDKEFMKYISNSLVIEDKPHVIEGYNNKVLRVIPFEGKHNDNSLKKIQSILQNNLQLTIKKPDLIDGKVSQYLKSLDIVFKDMPFELYIKILEIPVTSKEEMQSFKIITSPINPYFIMENGKGIFNFTDFNYKSYLDLLNLIKDYTNHKVMSERKYNSIIDNNYKKFRKKVDMNF